MFVVKNNIALRKNHVSSIQNMNLVAMELFELNWIELNFKNIGRYPKPKFSTALNLEPALNLAQCYI